MYKNFKELILGEKMVLEPETQTDHRYNDETYIIYNLKPNLNHKQYIIKCHWQPLEWYNKPKPFPEDTIVIDTKDIKNWTYNDGVFIDAVGLVEFYDDSVEKNQEVYCNIDIIEYCENDEEEHSCYDEEPPKIECSLNSRWISKIEINSYIDGVTVIYNDLI